MSSEESVLYLHRGDLLWQVTKEIHWPWLMWYMKIQNTGSHLNAIACFS